VNIILGVTGCIGAYKAAIILRLLQEAGCQVFPVMTSSAQQFITPLTFEKLSGNRVVSGLFNAGSTPEIEHISLARQSDLLLVAPATANILAKFAAGIADDFLSTIFLSTTTPIVAAPAMNVEMWRNPVTQRNVRRLREQGVEVVEPVAGALACGETGEGRLADPENIVAASLGVLGIGRSLQGKRVLVTAGPTIEDLDPVRYITNRSSGKMGYELASCARRRGAEVTLVSGATNLDAPSGVDRIDVRSAASMADAVKQSSEVADIVIMAAAVADYRPVSASDQKIKKDSEVMTLELEPTLDILRSLGDRKRAGQLLIGFAAESDQLERRAREKLASKNLDLIVANDISRVDTGFQSDDNQVLLIDSAGKVETEKLPKRRIAEIILDRVEVLLKNQPVSGRA
jgi:phosphopantothenoylcysteine decarboxylase/phosphopantothenate--cysteine ligase